ncbi:DUF559 domain-containing protein [Calidifontibacter sp. DB0510]|uniref:DUF559 domain-containing protein n=1 Tax=Metallococcus carri TaxID=1656884 RepID=A0A967EH00_9MICO|nr:DUF559 domain-containing protein [Metallococcus carri]NHN55743.1 DUF559 domain-containing protein [Metallococcus carri]NOP38568.1 DUF559 domain-containing protein [Calidifontibacter sp. DB2511S]
MNEFDIRLPFTAAEAKLRGITRSQLTSPKYRRVRRNCYVDARVPDSELLDVHAAVKVMPAAEFVCGTTAARIWGAAAPSSGSIHLGTLQRVASRQPDITLHRYALRPPLTEWSGLPITTPAQTFIDGAAHLTFVDGLVLADSLLRRTALGLDALTEAVCAVPGRPGDRLREIVAFARERVDSPYESRLRLLIVTADLPEPQVNLECTDGAGRERRIDLAYEEWKVAIEFDGRHHIERAAQWQSDIVRREDLEAQGWRFVVITSSDLHTKPLEVLRRIVDALVAAGAPEVAIGRAWRRFFPSAA